MTGMDRTEGIAAVIRISSGLEVSAMPCKNADGNKELPPCVKPEDHGDTEVTLIAAVDCVDNVDDDDVEEDL